MVSLSVTAEDDAGMNPELLKRLLEKKFILYAVAQVASTVLVGFDAIDGAQWTQLNMVILGTFTIDNVVESVAARRDEP
jgi:hypothetical protein